MPGRKTESVRHLNYESALAKPLVFSSKYFHLLVLCCLVLTHLLWYNITIAAASLTSSLGWRPHTEFISLSAALPLQENKAQQAQRHLYLLDITVLETPHLLLASLSMVTYSKSGWFLTGKPLFLAVVCLLWRPKKNTRHSFSAFPSTAASQAGLRLIPPKQPCCSCLATEQPAAAPLTLV